MHVEVDVIRLTQFLKTVARPDGSTLILGRQHVLEDGHVISACHVDVGHEAAWRPISVRLPLKRFQAAEAFGESHGWPPNRCSSTSNRAARSSSSTARIESSITLTAALTRVLGGVFGFAMTCINTATAAPAI